MKIRNIKKNSFIIALFGLFFFLSIILIDGVPFIFSDGYGYFHTATTLGESGKFYTEEEPEYIEYAFHGVEEYENKYINRYSPGTAIILAIPLKISSFLTQDTTIYNDYYKAFNGHTLLDGITVLITTVTAFLITIYSLVLILKEIGIRSKFITRYSIIASVIGLLILPYVFNYPAFSHTYEALFMTLTVLFATILYKREEIKYLPVLAGVSAFLLLIKPTNLFIIIPIVIFALYSVIRQKHEKKSLFKAILLSGFIAISITSTYLFYNLQSYGGLLTNGYEVLSGETLDLTSSNHFNLLFSGVRGWVVYSPIVLISTLGLFFIVKTSKKSVERIFYLSTFILPPIIAILIYGLWPNWWGGDAIGQRFLIALLPFVVIGVAYALKHSSEKNNSKAYMILKILILILTIYSGLVMLLIRVTPTSRLNEFISIEDNYDYITDSEEYRVIDLFRYHTTIASDASSPKEYVTTLTSGLKGGRSFIMILSGQTNPLIKLETSENEIKLHIIPKPLYDSKEDSLHIAVVSDQRVYYQNINQADLNKQSVITFNCSLPGAEWGSVPSEVSIESLDSVLIDSKQDRECGSYVEVIVWDDDGVVDFVDEKLGE